jgi:hypothetical protein
MLGDSVLEQDGWTEREKKKEIFNNCRNRQTMRRTGRKIKIPGVCNVKLFKAILKSAV